MSLVKRRISARRLAANQANAQKSTGPRTPDGKARVALNGLKNGGHAESGLQRLIMRRMGEEPAEYELVHQQMKETWHPDDAMQAMIVRSMADKVWEKQEVRHDRQESRLTAFLCDQIEGQRRELRARRTFPGEVPETGSGPCLWQETDSPSKFRRIGAILNDFENWSEDTECPEELGGALNDLYGDVPTLAGVNIERLFEKIFDAPEGEAADAEVKVKLLAWIRREREDVAREQELYQREQNLRTRRPNLPEKQLLAREAALDRQIADDARLLLQLKSKRSLLEARPEETETVATAGIPPGKGPAASDEAPSAESHDEEASA